DEKRSNREGLGPHSAAVKSGRLREFDPASDAHAWRDSGGCEASDGKHWSDHYASTAAATTGERRVQDPGRPGSADRAETDAGIGCGCFGSICMAHAACVTRPVVLTDVSVWAVERGPAGSRRRGSCGLRADRAGAVCCPLL